ncbi:hypothetical protein H6P81_000976 [Aristolochia fimbriata]|uniref:Cation/H+ exchanger domain-containing protein n=1 Tax=Aristolochia fimbriata TaxID=158543 RepID=A0AAV7FA73_ARIFI|nr:hypothetical protein H6P81_000976 [Aristolochia fimbriata]
MASSAMSDDCYHDYAGNFMAFFVSIVAILFGSRVVHFFLKYLGQPRLVGMVLGNTRLINLLDPKLPRVARMVGDIGVMGHFFVLGLGMEPRTLIQTRPSREAVLSTAGIVGTFVIIICIHSVTLKGLGAGDTVKYIISLGLSLSNTSSTLLTRIITDLKIGKSEIGRLAVNAAVHNDMATMTSMVLYLALQSNIVGRDILFDPDRSFVVAMLLFLQTWFLRNTGRRCIDWINDRNPDGRPMNGCHLLATVLFVFALCCCSPFMGYNGAPNAFLIGLTLPSEGRLSRTLLRKINTCLTDFIFPFYYAFAGSALNLGSWKGWVSLRDLSVLLFLAMGGKVIGTVVVAVPMGFGFLEAICLGLLLNVKGHYNILAAVNAYEVGVSDATAFLINVTTVLLTIVYIPLVAVVIVWRARKLQGGRPQMALQLHNPSSELRVMTCLHDPQYVPSLIKFLEATRGAPLSPGLVVYAVDLVELTSRTAATLTYGRGIDAVDVSDEAIVEMRGQVTAAFNAFLSDNGDGISLRRLLIVSPFNTMHLDICNAVQDAVTPLVILPFHKQQRVDGTMDEGNHELRAVNRKVLQHAPCSVGILVDRGLAVANTVSFSIEYLQVAVVFIGGPDDREALCYAGRLADSPGVKLTAIRFILEHEQSAVATASSSPADDNANNTSERRLISPPPDVHLDDQCFSDFYDRHVNNGRAYYMEQYIPGAAEIFSVLHALEGQFNLFVVGRGGSHLTDGMGSWEECPELGPLGDNLASSDFSITASVLIIQQHNPETRDDDSNIDDFPLG